MRTYLNYMTFKDLGIIEPILQALQEEGYSHPTPIQEQAIPILLNRKDLLGCAQTGTGKTAAFTVPILQHLYNSKQDHKGKRKIRSLIVTPTRELAIQIEENLDCRPCGLHGHKECPKGHFKCGNFDIPIPEM